MKKSVLLEPIVTVCEQKSSYLIQKYIFYVQKRQDFTKWNVSMHKRNTIGSTVSFYRQKRCYWISESGFMNRRSVIGTNGMFQ